MLFVAHRCGGNGGGVPMWVENPLYGRNAWGQGVKANIGDKVISLSSLVSHPKLEKEVPVNCLRN